MCKELAIQLERAREEAEKMILESEVEKFVLRREKGLKNGRQEESEENFDWKVKSPLLTKLDEIQSSLSVRNPHLDQSLASELGCTLEEGFQLEQYLHSSQDVASQTDLFASELEVLKQAIADDLLEEKHLLAIEEDDCSLDINLEEGESQEEVVGYDGKPGNIMQKEAVGKTETSLEEELRSSFLPGDGHLESPKNFSRTGKASSIFCDRSNILGLEMLMCDEESESSFDREASIRKPSSVDCAVNTETSTNEKKLPNKTFAGFVKSLLAWLLLFLTVFTTCGAVRVDHKVHLPSTWLLLYQLFGPYLPLPTISVAFDSNPRPHIN